MSPRIVTTADGSHTLINPEINESYHSLNGAISESMHVFIEAGLAQLKKDHINILEVGFGTGLNALLTWQYSLQHNLGICYHGIERFPVPYHIAERLNYTGFLGKDAADFFSKLHLAPWNTEISPVKNFVLHKTRADIHEISLPGQTDLVYFDAFSPDKQPDMWSEALFRRIFEVMTPGGILTSYSAKGSVRRMLQSTGYVVELLPGPPGKRQMLRAKKTS